MAEYKLVDAEQLDRAVQATADAIKTKGETTEKIPWDKDTGFKEAVLAIQSGVELNFEIVGGTTRPANPKENTIWVNTSEEITSWIFSAEEPENPEQGMVWFFSDVSSNAAFNALKENCLQVYPFICYQYTNGAWFLTPAEIFQGEEWVLLWQGELYTPGDEWEAITGGWTVDGYSVAYEGNIGKVYIGTKTESYLQTNYVSGWNFYMFGTQLPINLSNVDYIEFNVEHVSGEGLYIYASGTKNINMLTTMPQALVKQSGIVNLDVSGIDSAYIAIIPFPMAAAPAVWRVHKVRCVR